MSLARTTHWSRQLIASRTLDAVRRHRLRIGLALVSLGVLTPSTEAQRPLVPAEAPPKPPAFPQTRATPVRLILQRGADVTGLLVDYFDQRYYLRTRASAKPIRIAEQAVVDVEFLDGRFGIELPASEMDPRGWEPTPDTARPCEIQRVSGAAKSSRGRVRLDSQSIYHDFLDESGRRRHIQFSVRDGVPRLESAFGGYDVGHFVDLGPINWREVEFRDGRLKLPNRTQTYELCSYWSDARPQQIQRVIRAVRTHVYLMRTRTEGWDAVLKLRVIRASARGVAFDFEILFEYDASAIERRNREQADWARTGADELGRSGIRLYSRTAYQNYIKATMSFLHATRDAAHLTRNRWEVQLIGDGRAMFFDLLSVRDSRGMADLGPASETRQGPVELDGRRFRSRVVATAGHAYAIPLENDPTTDRWVRFVVEELVDQDSAVVTFGPLELAK